MSLRLAALSALLCLSLSFPASADGKHDAAERYIKQKEAEWAEQSVSNDDGLLRRLLADDYIGVSSSAQVETKKRQIEEALAAQKQPSEFVSNRVDYVDVRFFSDNLAVAQGQESWVLTNGEHGRYIWTDTWLRRKGQWQIIASQDTKLPPAQ
jgi:hypothetical protein